MRKNYEYVQRIEDVFPVANAILKRGGKHTARVSRNDSIMLLLNFSHLITESQRAQIEAFAREPIEEIRTIPVQINQQEPLEPQIRAIVNTAGFTSQQWQTARILVNPPGYAPAAFVLLAELHGRMGHFPTLLRLRPVPDLITTYEVAELLSLQNVRDAARQRRGDNAK